MTASWWLRFPTEASACPACTSPRITLVDVMSIRRDIEGRRVTFLTGCHDCGLLFTNPIPTEEQLERYYADEGPYRAHKVEAGEARRLERKGRARKTERAPRARDLLLNALTDGQPLRLRLVATRTAATLPPPASPLAPALGALRRYDRTRGGLTGRIGKVLPVRLRAALMDRAREGARRLGT